MGEPFIIDRECIEAGAVFTTGLLRAICPPEYLGHPSLVNSVRFAEIERRILRIEAALSGSDPRG